MSNTRVMSAERDENLAPLLRIVLPNLIFGAAFITLRERQERRAMLAGAAVYAVLVAIADVVASVARAMQAEGKDEAILIMSFPAGLAKQTSDPSLVFMPIKTFPRRSPATRRTGCSRCTGSLPPKQKIYLAIVLT